MDESTKPIRVLLVDDEEDFLASVRKPLKRRGFVVTTAPDGEEAIEEIEHGTFDVVVLDVRMPGMNGEQVFHEIRRRRPGLPIVMLTGHGTIAQAFRTSKDGVFDYLAKPCDVEILADVLRRATADLDREYDDPAMAPTNEVCVLVIDDDTDLLDSLSQSLSRRNIVVSIAPDGERGLAQAESKVFDVVLLDLEMPGIGGPATLTRFKGLHPYTEVIALTAQSDPDASMVAILNGAFDVLTKPVDVDELLRRVRDAVDWRLQRVEQERQRRKRHDQRRTRST